MNCPEEMVRQPRALAGRATGPAAVRAGIRVHQALAAAGITTRTVAMAARHGTDSAPAATETTGPGAEQASAMALRACHRRRATNPGGLSRRYLRRGKPSRTGPNGRNGNTRGTMMQKSE